MPVSFVMGGLYTVKPRSQRRFGVNKQAKTMLYNLGIKIPHSSTIGTTLENLNILPKNRTEKPRRSGTGNTTWAYLTG